jgi:sensor histidine kinase regulating citrate/malate metabolism
MDMMDVCTIFSNIIDNAIEACDKIDSSNILKTIKIESKYIDNFCIILIENTKINEIIQKRNLFVTSKKNPYVHGIGLKNIKKTVKKYLGEVVINYSENKFIVKIMIPCNK